MFIQFFNIFFIMLFTPQHIVTHLLTFVSPELLVLLKSFIHHVLADVISSAGAIPAMWLFPLGG